MRIVHDCGFSSFCLISNLLSGMFCLISKVCGIMWRRRRRQEEDQQKNPKKECTAIMKGKEEDEDDAAAKVNTPTSPSIFAMFRK